MKTFSCLTFAVAGVLALGTIPASAADTLVFTAPPRDVGGGDEPAVYGPVAEALSKATGKNIVYKHPGDWLSYQSEMRKGAYDIVFDGPHFVSWRIAQLGHQPIAKLQGKLVFVVIARKNDDKVGGIKDLIGRPVCGMPSPNLASLTMYSLFENPARQPVVRQTGSFKEAYDQLLEGKCLAAAMGKGFYNRFDKEGGKTKVLYTSPGVPNQAFSASRKFNADDRRKMAEVLTAPDAPKKMEKFFAIFSKDKTLVPTNSEEFSGVATLLKDVYGFDLPAAQMPTKAASVSNKATKH